MLKKYRTRDLFNYIGVPRDTLRFYEEKGLLNPKKNSENNYRNYDIYDIYNLMIIDFYKKRGMTIHQIQNLSNISDMQDMEGLLTNKKNELEKLMHDTQCMLKRIEETQEFSRDLERNLNTFTFKSLPLYRINGEISDFIAVEEYENVKDIMSSNNEDMFSQIMRYISFDENGVTGTKMLIVDSAEIKNNNDHYIPYTKCLYTVVEQIHPQDEQEDLIEKMYMVSSEYANKHGIRLLGEAFAMIRLISHKGNKIKTYIEIFIPFE